MFDDDSPSARYVSARRRAAKRVDAARFDADGSGPTAAGGGSLQRRRYAVARRTPICCIHLAQAYSAAGRRRARPLRRPSRPWRSMPRISRAGSYWTQLAAHARARREPLAAVTAQSLQPFKSQNSARTDLRAVDS